MLKKFTVYADPGHAWVKVPKSLLIKLGIDGDISRYSYEYKDYAYLEEDCDLARFHVAYERVNGFPPVYTTSHTNKQSKIRGYNRYGFSALRDHWRSLIAARSV